MPQVYNSTIITVVPYKQHYGGVIKWALVLKMTTWPVCMAAYQLNIML